LKRKIMSTQNTVRAILLIAVTLCLSTAQNSFAKGCKLLTQTGCACCPVCDHVCKLDAEEVEEEKTCFEVESKAICIPRVVFPWQKAKKVSCASCDACDGKGCTVCVHNGARVRKVCVLKTEKYKCPACKYTWSAEKKDSCGGCASSCNGGPSCDGGCVCDFGCDAGEAVALPVPTAPSPAAAVLQRPTFMPTPVAGRAAAATDYYRPSPELK
jgi:hypothetical protein